jgi:hypothetical protein
MCEIGERFRQKKAMGGSDMAFPDERILTTADLSRTIKESNANRERFCFVLGSGASVESGIPSGNTLEMVWMDDGRRRHRREASPPGAGDRGAAAPERENEAPL